MPTLVLELISAVTMVTALSVLLLIGGLQWLLSVRLLRAPGVRWRQCPWILGICLLIPGCGSFSRSGCMRTGANGCSRPSCCSFTMDAPRWHLTTETKSARPSCQVKLWEGF